MHNLILCGFMGCGKTTVGKRLASRLSMEYVDLDEDIQREAGLPIPEIFATFGEPYFRELEFEAIKGLAKRIGCVVSTGGGALVSEKNAAVLDRKHDLLVFLDAPFEICYERIKDSDRPIVRRSTAEELRRLYDERRGKYLASSPVCVDAGGSAADAVERILLLYGGPQK